MIDDHDIPVININDLGNIDNDYNRQKIFIDEASLG